MANYLFLPSAFADAAPARKFALFGALHLAILFVTVSLPFALSRLTRREQRPQLARVLALTLAGVLLFDRVFALGWSIYTGRIAFWANGLPMHLCDWASFAVIVALVGRRQLPYELAYLWGLSGTFQAVLTPDNTEDLFSPLFISFFVEHCGIIVSVLFLTWGLGMRPKPGAIVRVWLCSQVYLAAAGLADWLFRTQKINFGYLAAKPESGSLMDWFGPWPWYILALEVLALVFYTIFYAPFWLADRRAGRVVSVPTVDGPAPRDRSSAIDTLPPRTDTP